MSDEQDLAEMELAHQWETLTEGLAYLSVDRGFVDGAATVRVSAIGTEHKVHSCWQRHDESRGQAIVRALMQAQGK